MRYLFTIVLISGFSWMAQAQKNELNEKVTNQLRQRGSLRQLPKQKEAQRGNPYLYANYQSGGFKLIGKNTTYTAKQMRYNALYNYLEVMQDGVVQVIDVDKLSTMYVNVAGKKMYYINVTQYKQPGKHLTGLFQLVLNGEVKLLKQTNAYLKKATYNVALNVGQNYDEIKQKETYYFSKGSQVHKLNSKRSILKFFKNTSFQAKTYVKKHRLNIRTVNGKKQLLIAYHKHLLKNGQVKR